MSVTEYDFNESNSRFETALDLSRMQAIAAGLSLAADSPAPSDKSDFDWHVDIKEETDIIVSNKGNKYDNTPSNNHSVTYKNPGYRGEPDSSVDILDVKTNKVKTRRWFGKDGKAIRDLDMTNHNNPKEHTEVPHEHLWEYNSNGNPKRNK